MHVSSDELKSLRDSVTLAKKSFLNPDIELVGLYFNEERTETILVAPLVNIKQFDTEVISTETTVFVGGTEYSHEVEKTPLLLRPNRPLNFYARLPKNIVRDLKRKKTTLKVAMEFGVKGVLEDVQYLCLTYEHGEKGDKYSRPPGAPEECRKSREQRAHDQKMKG